jgi:hypothetical protein
MQFFACMKRLAIFTYCIFSSSNRDFPRNGRLREGLADGWRKTCCVYGVDTARKKSADDHLGRESFSAWMTCGPLQ